jgi:hypothetical protein
MHHEDRLLTCNGYGAAAVAGAEELLRQLTQAVRARRPCPVNYLVANCDRTLVIMPTSVRMVGYVEPTTSRTEYVIYGTHDDGAVVLKLNVGNDSVIATMGIDSAHKAVETHHTRR